MTAKDTVRALLDRMPEDCSLDDVLYHPYVVQAVGRGIADGEAGRVIPHEQVATDLLAARVREVVLAESARDALDDVIEYIARDSPQAAVQVLEEALRAGASLATLSERGRIVPELNDPTTRELLVFKYRLLYEVRGYRVRVDGEEFGGHRRRARAEQDLRDWTH